MSVMDKLINAMKFNDDEDFDEDEEYEDEDYYGDDKPAAAAEPVRSSRAAQTSASFDDLTEDEEPVPAPRARKRFGGAAADKSESSTVSRQVKKQYSEAGMEVCIIKPTSVNDAREVTDTLLANSTVVLNLEGLDVEIAQRIIDFTSGSCYAVHGNVMKISHYIFVITPANVDVTAEDHSYLSISKRTGRCLVRFLQSLHKEHIAESILTKSVD